jgi:imidazolonepropionase-like amidohydrolase
VNDLLVRHAALLTSGATEPAETDILIRGGEIAEVGANLVTGADLPVLDVAGKTVVPGLIDAHCHAYGISLHEAVAETWPLSYVAYKAGERLGRALRRGFTTVRDVAGGDPGLGRAIAEGLLAAPRYYYTGPALSQTGGHGDPRDGMSEAPLTDGRTTVVVDGPDEVRRMARWLLSRGAHAIKLMTSGGVVSQTDPLAVPQFTAEEIRAAVEVASVRGSYVTAHSYSAASVRHSIDNGIRSIEHGNLIDQATAEAMAAAGAFLVPTLAAYDAMARRAEAMGMSAVSLAKNNEVLEFGKVAIGHARRAGVKIGFGSDLMGDLEDDQLVGLALQTDADGLLNTLYAATLTNAELLRNPKLGRVEPGCVGDLLVLDGDLLATPSLLWDESHPRTVVQAGRVV